MPFPPASILDSLIPGSTPLGTRPTTLEEFLGDLPEGFSVTEAETLVETYHETHKAEARALFHDIAEFLEICAEARNDSTVPAWMRHYFGKEDEYQYVRTMKLGLECSLDLLNEREYRLRTLEALPTDGLRH